MGEALKQTRRWLFVTGQRRVRTGMNVGPRS